MKISQKGIEFIEKLEGVRFEAYKDSGGIWTIGAGHTGGVKEGDVATPEQVDQWLEEDLHGAETAINAYVKSPLNQNQFDALVSLVFNIGAGNFHNSTVLRLLNLHDYLGAGNAFLMWNKVNGKEITGLTSRRYAERTLFQTPVEV